jgi:hypothetical protein
MIAAASTPRYAVHPCADVFPMMSDKEIAELADDIQVNGLREPIVIWRPHDDADRIEVLDGRNRLAALLRLGVTINWPGAEAIWPDGHTQRISKVNHTDDPAAFVISANIRRRHLTKEQRAELIVKTIQAGKNDRATVARSFSPTVGARGGSTKDPVLEQAVTEAAKHGISKRTVQNARAKINGKTLAPRKKMGVSSTMPIGEARPLAPPPPSTYEWVDKRLTELRTQQTAILTALAELDATAPKLTAAERRTVRDRLVAVRTRIDQSVVHFGGRHKEVPDVDTPRHQARGYQERTL